MRLHVRMRSRLENGILHNGQQLGSAVNSFFDQGKFEAMKTLNGCGPVCCNEHQFRAKIKVIEPFLSYRCLISGQRKMALSLPNT